MRLSTVLFDLDGTLTDSQSGIVASYRHTLTCLGVEASDRQIRTCIGPPLYQGLLRLGVAPPEIDRGVEIYRAFFAEHGIFDNELYPGAAELLAALTAEGLVLGLATSKLESFADTIVDYFALTEYFSVVVGASRDGSRLQKEEIVGHALDLLGGPEPGAAAMVGDRQHDIYAAVEHGLHPIGVLWGYGSKEELSEAGAVRLVESMGELALLLGAMALPAPRP